MAAIETLDEYQQLVVGLRRAPQTEGWEELNGEIGSEESLEVFTQHSNSMTILAPDRWWTHKSIHNLPPSARFGFAEEIGDVLWFAADTASRSGIYLTRAIESAVQENRIATDAPSNFEELGLISRLTAPSLRVATTLGFDEKLDKPVPHTTSLPENPFLVYGRSILRVIKSINPEVLFIGQRRAIDSEAAKPVSIAVGELILATAYVSEVRLGIPIGLIAQYNIEKLEHRAQYGKGKLPATEWFAKNLS